MSGLSLITIEEENEFSEKFVSDLRDLLREYYKLDKETRAKEFESWDNAVNNLLKQEEARDSEQIR